MNDNKIKRLMTLFSSKPLFLDADAIKNYQILAACDNSELVMETLRRSSDIIICKPVFDQIEQTERLENHDFNSWANNLRRDYGLSVVTLYYVNDSKLPKLTTPRHETSLSQRDYEIVRYAVNVAGNVHGAIIDCATPGVMELYRKELWLVSNTHSCSTKKRIISKKGGQKK